MSSVKKKKEKAPTKKKKVVKKKKSSSKEDNAGKAVSPAGKEVIKVPKTPPEDEYGDDFEVSHVMDHI
jgi:hypothetical protein